MPQGLLDDGRFYKLQKTCRVCKRTESLAVWNRIAQELGASLLIERQSNKSTFMCPRCARTGRHGS